MRGLAPAARRTIITATVMVTVIGVFWGSQAYVAADEHPMKHGLTVGATFIVVGYVVIAAITLIKQRIARNNTQ